MASLGHPDCF
jgi:hypothetical protein